MERARQLAVETNLFNAAIAALAGYTQIAHLRANFIGTSGMSPEALRAVNGVERSIS